MTHAGGRPRKVRKEEFCPYPQCGEKGHTFHVRIRKKSSNVYIYPRFRHDNRSIRDHNIYRMIKNESRKPIMQIREHDRGRKEVTSISYLPQPKSAIRQYKINNALPIVIYEFPKIKEVSTGKELELELRRLKRSCLKLNEANWLRRMAVKIKPSLKNGAHKFYNDFYANLRDNSRNIIITFGNDALIAADRILSYKFNGDITEFYDKYGLLEKLLERREHKRNRSRGQFGSEKWAQ